MFSAYFNHLKNYFQTHPQPSYESFQSSRHSFLQNTVPFTTVNSVVAYDVECLVAVHASPIVPTTQTSLVSLTRTMGNKGQLHHLQRNFVIMHRQDGAVYQLYAYITLQNFDQDCLDSILAVSTLQHEIPLFIKQQLVSFKIELPPLSQATLYTRKIADASSMYDYFQCQGFLYNIWFIQRGNGVLRPVPHIVKNKHCYYRVQDLIVIYSSENTNTDSYQRAQTCYRKIIQTNDFNRLLKEKMSSFDAKFLLEKSYIAPEPFISYILPLIESSFAKEIKSTYAQIQQASANTNESTYITCEDVTEAVGTPSIDEGNQSVAVSSNLSDIMVFDPTQCGNYVYLAKWIKSCGKRCRFKKSNENWLVCVTDMMFIHGDYKDEDSTSSQWRKIRGKPQLCDLEIHGGGRNLGDYLTLLDFYVHILPFIRGPIADSIRNSRALTSIAGGLGGGAHLDNYKRSIQKELLQLVEEDPDTAQILWQFKMDTDTAQTEYLPDEHLVTDAVTAVAEQDMALVVRDTEMHRANQEVAKRDQEIAKRDQEDLKHKQELAKRDQEDLKHKQELAKTASVEAQEKSKQVKYDFEMQFKVMKESEQTNRTTATQNGLSVRATEKRKEIDAKARIESEKEQTKRSQELTKQKAIEYNILLLQKGIHEPGRLENVETIVRPKAKRGRPRR